MAVIGARVDSEIKQVFNALARARSTTASRLAGFLIADFIKADKGKAAQTIMRTELPAQAFPAAHAGVKTQLVHVRPEPYYHEKLGRLAARRKWYRSAYLASLLQAHVDRRSVLCHVEVYAVRHVARQHADIGRNLNQIARNVNIDPDRADISATLPYCVMRVTLHSLSKSSALPKNFRRLTPNGDECSARLSSK